MRKGFSALLVAFAATASAGGSDTQEPEASKTDLQRFHLAVDQISGQIANAGTKLKGGAVSMRQDSGEAPATTAQLCCGSNIDKIEKRFETLATSIRNLRACYRAKENVDAEVQLNFVHQDALSLHRALGNFTNAKRTEALLGYEAMIRSTLLLKKSAKNLTECEQSGTP